VHRAIELLEDGDRIKVTVRFRGRELTHPELGRNLIARFADRVKDHGIAERTPLLEGKSMHITMASTHKPKVHEGPAPRGGDGAAPAAPAPAATPGAEQTTPVAEAPTSEASATKASAGEAPAPKPAAAARPAAAKAVDAKVETEPVETPAEEARTRVAAARSEPKSTNEKTPAPEPVRTGE
jgi:hypothetical protein